MGLVSKVMAMKPHELFSRLHRKLNIIQEELRLHPDYQIPQETAHINNFSLLGFEKDEEGIQKCFRKLFPQEVKRLVQKAQNILEHRFDLLGYENLNFGDDIDWTLEPNRKKKIPLVHWSKIFSMKLEEIGDLKIVWELNRHQHLVCLGQAYFLTGDNCYAEEVHKQICDWQEKNPPHKGPNWASSLEVALRLISWIWALKLIKGSPRCDREFLNNSAAWIGEHAKHIERFLSTYYSPNTHLTGEALGLFYAGVFFPNLPEAPRWRRKGKDILFRMLPIHLLSDGGYVERTLWYHQYTICFYLHFFILLETLGEEIPSWAWKRVEDGVTFLMYSLKPDRTIPMVGDDDGGFFLPLSTKPFNDPCGILAVCASLFRRGDFKALAGTSQPETLWLLGIDGEDTYQKVVEQLPEETSKGFKETGYFFLRSGWGQKGNFMAFDCGPHGWLNGGHAHADLLSFHVVSGENSVIEDPGTYQYINENGWRGYFRGPKGHATLWVDGKAPAIPSDSFHWEKVPTHKLHCFHSSSQHDYVAGSMYADGLGEMVREVHFIKPHNFLIIDTVKGVGEQKLEVRFPLAAGKWSLLSSGCWRDEKENPYGIIFLQCAELRATLEPSWISPVYGKKEISNTLVLSGTIVLPSRKAYLIDLSGTGPQEKPSFVLKKNTFRLSIGKDSWVGFGAAESKQSILDEEIETDFRAGLLKCLSSGDIEVVAVYEGSYLYFQGKEIYVGHNERS